MFKKLGERLGLRARSPKSVSLDGAYRPHRPDDVQRFTALAAEAFPDLTSRIECFGSSWLGWQFATDRARLERGEPLVLLLDPGGGEVFEIPATLASFHERELIEDAEAVLATPFYREWLEGGRPAPTYAECVGYKRPLYLGGDDMASNLELANFEVYWGLAAQLLAQVRGLPVGTRIGRVSIGDEA